MRSVKRGVVHNLAERYFTNQRETSPEFIFEMSAPSYLRAQSDGVLLAIKLQPRASANEIGFPLGEELRIKVTAPPVDAAANEALLQLLSERLDCPRRQLALVRGQTSRHKVVKIYSLSVEEVVERLVTGD